MTGGHGGGEERGLSSLGETAVDIVLDLGDDQAGVDGDGGALVVADSGKRGHGDGLQLTA